MTHNAARRLLAGLAAGCAVVAVVATPASAAPAAADISIYLRDLITPAGASGASFSPIWSSSSPVDLEQPQITYTLGGDLAGVSLSAEDSDCQSVSPTELTCSSLSGLWIGTDPVSGYFTAFVVADASAAIGATGTLTATFSADGVEPITQTARVRVAEAVDLTAGPPSEVTGSPGSAFTAPLSVLNSGGNAVTGASAVFFDDWAFQPGARYRNCLYRDGRVTACTFRQTLAPGATYETTMPYRVRRDTKAPGFAAGETQWMTPADLADFARYLESQGTALGTPGTGPELTLREATYAVRGLLQTDAHPDDNWSSVSLTVTGRNGVDLAATGDEVRGAVGDEVTATAGVRNVGRATLDWGRVGSPAAVTAVYTPAGTTVVSAPVSCYPVIDGWGDESRRGEPGHAKYECQSGYLLKAGDRVTYDFGLRIDAPGRGRGSVVVNEPCECERFADDINVANNMGPLVVIGRS